MPLNQFLDLDNFLTPLIKQGLSFYHIKQFFPDQVPISIASLYRYTDNGYFSFQNIDLQKSVRYKKYPKRHRSSKTPIPKDLRATRNYQCYLNYIRENPTVPIVQMDTVIGKSEDKQSLLTMILCDSSYTLITLLKSRDAQAVVDAFNELEDILGFDEFKRLFGVILTDNGSEFSKVLELEHSHLTGEKRCHIFFCDPMCSHQKGEIERANGDIRLIIPKGVSMDFLDENRVTKITNNINNFARPSLNGKTPHDLAFVHMGLDVMSRLGLHYIRPDKVVLKPYLIK